MEHAGSRPTIVTQWTQEVRNRWSFGLSEIGGSFRDPECRAAFQRSARDDE
jgi:hypothetical protein